MAAPLFYNLAMVFERTSNWDFPEVTMTYRMIRVLDLTEGQRSVAEICQALDLSYDALFSDLQRLHELKLVRFCSPKAPKASRLSRTQRGVF